jgi:hypothetical protein
MMTSKNLISRPSDNLDDAQKAVLGVVTVRRERSG